MFHSVLMTTLAPIRDTNEVCCWDNRPITTLWPETKQEKLKDTNVKKTIKKKKRNRTMFTTDQIRMLEKIFARSKYIDVERRREISECLQIEQKCIKIWFQNRRMKEKKELSESCDSTSESHVSNLASFSPPLDSPKPSNSESDIACSYSHVNGHMTPSQYYYDAPNNSIKTELQPNEQIAYESYPNSSISHVNYDVNTFYSNAMRNNIDYSSQYYPSPSEYHYYYNTGEVNFQPVTTNDRDLSANIYDTSYL